MPWPTPQDYNEAVQSPALCFSLPELRGGKPELTPLGLPRAVTGGFASVYRISYRGSDWAVRCFLRQVADQQQRYEAISNHLTRAGLPYTAGFQYLEQGIKVQGRWYPVLKMEWVQGMPLNSYVQQNLSRPEQLRALAAEWLNMLEALRSQDVAHGDLQHGNVLVHEGKLFLIDYDGMYVPALRHKGSNELGHRNYQHPQRNSQHFGPWLDNFSGWLVYVSLLALSHEPALWQLAGDEHLLFRKDDLERPGQTEIWRLLAGGREEVPALTASLAGFLKQDPSLVPAPELNEVQRFGRRRQRLRVRASRPAPKVVRQSAATFAGPSWVLDHLTPDGAPQWQGSLLKERLLTGFWLLINAVLISSAAQGTLALTTTGYLTGGSSMLALLGLFSRYQTQPAVRQKRQLLQEQHALKWRSHLENWRIYRLHRRRSRLQRAGEDDRAAFKQRVEGVLQRERQAVERVDNQLEKGLKELDERRRQYRLSEAKELAQILANKRMQAVQALLRDYTVLGSDRLVLPAEIKVQLDRSGLISAADLVDVQVTMTAGPPVVSVQLTGRGSFPACFLSAAQGRVLLKWRRELEQQLLPTVPTPSYGREGAAIKRRYEALYQGLSREAADLEARAAKRRTAAGKRSRGQTDRALRWLRKRQEQIADPAGRVHLALTRQLERQAIAEQDLRECEQQLSSYRPITFAGYLSRLVGLRSKT